MFKKICFAYPWATAGGCERVFLNRAVELHRCRPGMKIDIFFGADCGGAPLLREFIKLNGLQDNVKVTFQYDGPYDCVFAIDYPAVKKYTNKDYVVWECHTAYAENRQWLKTLDLSGSLLLFPAADFRGQVLCENKNLDPSRCLVMQNFAPRIDYRGIVPSFPGWSRRPFVFFGRMDTLKNPEMLIRAYSKIKKRGLGEKFFLVFVGGQSDSVNMNEMLSTYQMGGDALVLPPIPFAHTAAFLEMVKRQKGIFVSPSQGESYGFSAAEAIVCGIPTLLSDIKAHRNLLSPIKDLLFENDNANMLADMLLYVSDHYDEYANIMSRASANKSIGDFSTAFRFLEHRICHGACPL